LSPCRYRRWLGVVCAASLVAGSSVAQAPVTFEPEPVAAGTVRIWGDRYMSSVVATWEKHFRRYHPEVQFVTQLMGTDTGMSGLYTGNADIALFGRESNTTENDGFLHTLQYRPLQLRLMTGSLDEPGMSFAPVLFVHKDNPLERLTLAQTDAVFGCGQAGVTPARTWGDLGLGGEWKDKPIHVYALDMESGTGAFFLHALQGESKKMNWPIVREFRDGRRPDGTSYEAAEQTMDTLRSDRYGLAVSSVRYAGGDVKALALAPSGGGAAYVQATRETLIDGSYPLARMTYVFVNQPPGKPAPPLVKEFLRFVYSDEGRKVVSDSDGFLPLTGGDAARQAGLIR
jgi:phosphate transport system substrate-binding protein